MFNRVRVLHLNRLKERTWLHSFGFFWHSVLYLCSTYWWVASEKLQKMWFCDVLYGWSQFIVHSAKYIQGFTYVAYGRGRVAEDNKGWTIMIIDQGPNVWASIGQRPLGYNVFARMSVALKKNIFSFLEKIVKLLRSIARCSHFPNFL